MDFYYEVDPYNRIVARLTGRRSVIKKFRKIISGRFKTDKENNLYYEITKSQDIETPQKVALSGKYSIDKNHNLIVNLDKWDRQYLDNRLVLKTELADANDNEIMFLLHTKELNGKRSVYLLNLEGSWKADENNRLTFGVEKENNKVDILTFYNAWKINKRNEIIYRYGQGNRIITLRGEWNLYDKYTLSYTLDNSEEKTYVKFGVTVQLSKGRNIRRDIIFIGKWKYREGRTVILEPSIGDRTRALKLKLDILDKDLRGIC